MDLKIIFELIEYYKFKSDSFFKEKFPIEYNYIMSFQFGGSFKEKAYMLKYNLTEKDITCKYGNIIKFKNYFTGYQKLCTKYCQCHNENLSNVFKAKDEKFYQERLSKTQKTWMKKYGVDNPLKSNEILKKRNSTNIKKYGGNSPMHSKEIKEKLFTNNKIKYNFKIPSMSDQIKKKTKSTNFKKYGSESTFNSISIKEKIKKINIEKYGVDNPFKSQQIQEKIKKENQSKYGVNYPLESKEFRNLISSKNKENGLNHSNHKNWSTKTREILYNESKLFDLCKKHQNTTTILEELACDRTTFLKYYYEYSLDKKISLNLRSFYEIKISEFLLENNIKVIANTRKIISPYELDIFIPEFNIGIEINGLYWHSNKFKDQNYHNNKFLLSNKLGIELLQFWESDLIKNFNIIKNLILYKCKKLKSKVYARNCTIQNISFNDCKKLLNKHHIQGASKNLPIRLGAYYNNELVGVMAFRKIKNDLYELSRFATNQPINGLFSKMLSYFENNYKPSKIISYSDNMYSLGNLYYKNNFILSHDVPVSYYYTDLKSVFHRSLFSKNNIKKKFNISDLNKTEKEIMKELGYLRLYDAGKKCWVKQY